MASAVVNRYRPKRRGNVRIAETVHGSRSLQGEEANRLRLLVSDKVRAQNEREQQISALARRPRVGDSVSVRFAMRVIEQRIVRGLWVLEITLPDDGPKQDRQHGMGYMAEDIDHWGQAVSKGGWQPPPPRAAVPSGREIDAANEAKGWIDRLARYDEEQARLLRVAAQTKRGDRRGRVNWERVQTRIPQLRGMKLRTLQDRYDRALRWIVADLSVAKIAG